MFAWQAVAPEYFRGETLPKRDSADLVLMGVGPEVGEGVVGLRLPDSRESTVIAPDLSNLPPGQTAIDPAPASGSSRAPTTRSRRPSLDHPEAQGRLANFVGSRRI